MEYGRRFFQAYTSKIPASPIKLVEIGSLNVNGSLRDVCPDGVDYIGLDFSEGPGVDIVIHDPYKLPFTDESVDIVVTSSCFEHSEFFWLVFLEAIRVLKPSGLLYLNAPSNGFFHQWPVDCWRFYPDSGHALARWANRNGYDTLLLESFTGDRSAGKISEGGMWNDFVAVILKNASQQQLYPDRILDGIEHFSNGYSSTQSGILNLNELGPDFRLIESLQSNLDISTEAAIERDNQISRLSQAMAERENQIANLSQTVTERDSQITSLSRTVTERDNQITSLGQAMTECNSQIASLSRTLAERDSQIVSLSCAVAERSGQIASLSQAMADRDAQITSLSQAVAERSSEIARITSFNQSLIEKTRTIETELMEKLRTTEDKLARITRRTLSFRWKRLVRSIKKRLPIEFPEANSDNSRPFKSIRQWNRQRIARRRGNITLELTQQFDAKNGAAHATPQWTPDSVNRRVLVLDYRIPRGDTSAGELATVGILRDLIALGYEVVFAPNDMLPSPEYEAELRGYGIEIITRDSGFEYAANYIEQYGDRFGFFYIVRFDVAENVLPFIRKKAPHARVILHTPDLYFLREMRHAQLLGDADSIARAEETRRREIATMHASDHIVVVSPAEIPVLHKELPDDKPISVFPVLYTPIVENPRSYKNRSDIFFLGGFGHLPNVDAVHWFVNEIWPTIHAALPGVKFRIIGAEVPDSVAALSANSGVEVVGFVKDLEPVLESYRMSVAPLLYGAGIKGKVAMTMGAGIPCVCTEIAAEGMGIEHNVHALVENDADGFAASVIKLYQDESLWRRLSANGQRLVQARFGEVANRGSLLKVLNDARVLPLSLLHEFYDNASDVSVPEPAPDASVDVTIIIPVYNKWSLTRACVASVVQASAGSGICYEVILADDGSTDETTKAGELIPGLRVIKTPANMGFLRNCNYAATQARGRHILLLNNDTFVLPGWLEALYQTIEADESIAIVGSKLLYENGTIQDAGGGLLANADGVSIGREFFDRGPVRSVDRDEPVFNVRRETDYLTGASILIRASFWRTAGGFDERFGNAYCEDSDLAMQARAMGFRVVYEPASEVVHFEHQSYADEVSANHVELQRRNKILLLDKWRDVLARDHLPPGSPWHLVAARGERSIPPHVLARRQASNSLNILYFSPFPSHPSNHGNQATIQQFARRLQMLGHKVHFALLQSGMYDDNIEQSMRDAWDTLSIVPNTHSLLANGSPIPFDGWYEPGLGEHIRMLCARHDIDVVLCSYVFQSKLLEYIPSWMLRIIDTHDKMGNRYEMLRQKGLPLEFFSCTPEEEGAYLRRADVVFARRQEEADYFNAVSGTHSAVVVPHFEAPNFIQKSFTALRQIAIVASANQINLIIVRDCLAAIERQMAGRDCPFVVSIAGQVRDMVPSLPEHEAALFHRPWVRMLGFVPDIARLYEEVDLVISPVTIGTGINVKTVQAMAYGMPLLTTEWGSKGIDTTEPLHKLSDLDALARALLKLIDTPSEIDRLAAVSRIVYQKFFDTSLASLENVLQLVPGTRARDLESGFRSDQLVCA